MKTSIIPYTILLMLNSLVVISQNDFGLLVNTKLKNYSDTNCPEKIYVDTDKPYYFVNDTLWFSAYLVNGITHKKSTKSKVVYVELINNKDSIVDKRKLFIEAVNAKGDFTVKPEWQEGEYTLRAYTNYMRNYDPSYFFNKNINILVIDKTKPENNLDASAPKSQDLKSNKPDINFYPESGHLVENLTSKVALKIKDNIDSGMKISGYITDNEDTYVTHCKIYDFGLGLFNLTPVASKTYYFNIDMNGITYKYKIPKALPKGYTLTTAYTDKNLFIGLESSIEDGLNGAYLVLHQRGKILYDKVLEEKSKKYSLGFSTDGISEGVTHLTLFNLDGNPVCERLIFIRNEQYQATVKLKKDKVTLGTKEKISFSLSTENFYKSTISSHLSMSIRYSADIEQNDNSENIKTWLLLNSDLRGEIKNPNYFFSEPYNKKKQYLLDLVMMTNGWRRFTWQNVLYKNYKSEGFLPEKGITISGNTKLLEKPYTLTPSYTSLTFLGNDINVLPVQKSSSNGKFSFGPFIFYDSIPAIIQSRLNDFKSKRPEDRELQISVDRGIESPQILKKLKFKNLDDSEKYIKIKEHVRDINFQFYQNSQKLDEVVVIAKKRAEKTEREKQMDDRSTFGFPSYRLDIESDPFLKNLPLENVLTRFPGLYFNGIGFSSRGDGNPRFIIDNTEATLEDVLALTIDQVSFIDFYRGANASIYSNAKNGVITIYTRTGKSLFSNNTKRKPGIINFYAKGFYSAKEFYAPDYAKDTASRPKTDMRTTLYWNPKIRIDSENGAKEISFFTGDIKGKYIIEIEGISDTGIPLYQTSMFYVE